MGSRTIDRTFEIPQYSPVCARCRHLSPDGSRQCAAFPEPNSIPLPIWRGENSHTTPYPGDNGIRFEPVESDDAA